MNVLIKGIPPTLVEGWCPTSEQDRVNTYFEGAQFQFLSDVENSFYNYGDSTPSPEKRSFPWFRTVFGKPDRWYIFSNGYWLSPYHLPAQTAMRMIWVGSPAGLWLFDGGDGTDPNPAGATAPTITSGSFWEVDTDFAGVFPVGAGTIAGVGTNVVVGGTGGSSQITQTTEQMPAHTHDIGVEISPLVTTAEANRLRDYSGDIEYEATNETRVARTRATGGGQPMTIVPPYRGIYIVKRTIRSFYALPG